jgi:NAD(P)-dependent dehydrogenase (short-subunit alcohol dehydrogenase family)
MTLHGKTIVIVGGSSGIGFETARLALQQGAKVTISGRSEEKLCHQCRDCEASCQAHRKTGRCGTSCYDADDESIHQR